MATAVSTQLSALTGANTIEQMMGDVNSLKTLSALATDAAGSGDFVPTTGGTFTGQVIVNKSGFSSVTISSDSTSESQLRFDTNTAARISNQSETALLFDTNATERMRIDSSGNTGIGTTSPLSKLHVNGSILADANAGNGYGFERSGAKQTVLELSRIGADILSLINPLNNHLVFGTNDTERLRIDSSGNVGIGTTSMQGQFHVVRGAATAGWVHLAQTSGISNESGVYVDSSNNMELGARDGSGDLNVAFRSNGNSHLTGGNFGIGTSSPAEKFHIAGGSTTGALIVSESTSTSQYSGGGIALMNAATSNDNHVLINTFIRDSDSSDSVFTINKINGSRVYQQTLAQYDLSDNYWRFLTNDTERLRIDSSGDVSILTSGKGLIFPDGSKQTSAGATTGKAIAMAIVFG